MQRRRESPLHDDTAGVKLGNALTPGSRWMPSCRLPAEMLYTSNVHRRKTRTW